MLTNIFVLIALTSLMINKAIQLQIHKKDKSKEIFKKIKIIIFGETHLVLAQYSYN